MKVSLRPHSCMYIIKLVLLHKKLVCSTIWKTQQDNNLEDVWE